MVYFHKNKKMFGFSVHFVWGNMIICAKNICLKYAKNKFFGCFGLPFPDGSF